MTTKSLFSVYLCLLALRAVEEDTQESSQFEIKNIDKLKFGFVLVVTSYASLQKDTATNHYDVIFKIIAATDVLKPALISETTNASQLKVRFFSAAKFTLCVSEATKDVIFKGNTELNLANEETITHILKEKLKKDSLVFEDIESDEIDKVVTLSGNENGVGSDKPWLNIPLWTINLEVSGINWRQEEAGLGAPLKDSKYTFKVKNDGYKVVSEQSEEVERIYNHFVKSKLNPWYKSTAAIVIYSVVGGLLFLGMVFILVSGTGRNDK